MKTNPKVIGLYALDQILSVAAAGVALFWSAGRFNWWAAWAVLGVWAAWFALTDSLILRANPELMAERLKPPKSAKNWDRVILSVLRILQLVRYILAGLDRRHGWTSGFPLSAQIAGLVVSCLGYGLLAWAMVSNAYFSQVVRIQADRGHAVEKKGPYRFVRHPAYIGMILFELAISTLLASWAAILAGAVCSILIILRTALEDRTLQTELNGYTDYARQVRFRLLPGIW